MFTIEAEIGKKITNVEKRGATMERNYKSNNIKEFSMYFVHIFSNTIFHILNLVLSILTNIKYY